MPNQPSTRLTVASGFALDLGSLFVRPWKPVRASAGYVASLTVVAALIALLPLVYVGLIGLLGYAGFRFAIEWFPFRGSSGAGGARFAVVALVVYVSALAGFAGAMFFLLKPIIAPSREPEDHYLLVRQQEPRLFEFVDRLCDVIGAAKPKRIDVTAEPNASASFRRGLMSVFVPGDMVLTIGMPLAAGMNVSQFAGVLSHELGHFSQGAGMRAFVLIRTVQLWFVRAVYERDKWDHTLWLWRQEDSPGPLQLAGFCVAATVGAARMVLRVLLWVSAVLTAVLERRMEYNADLHQIRMVGSAHFEGMARRLDDLAYAYPLAVNEAGEMYERSTPRRVPDDIPSLVADHAGRITPEEKASVARERKANERGVFLSHPPMEKRVARARKLEEPGVIDCDLPASVLFHNFEGACRQATYGLFKEMLGNLYYDATVVSTAEVLAPRSSEGSQRQALARFAGFDPPSWRPLFPRIARLPDEADGRAMVERVKRARAAIKELGPRASAQVAVYRDASEEQLRCEQAKAAMDAGQKVDFKSLDMRPTSRAALSEMTDVLGMKIAAAVDEIEPAMEAAQARMTASLSLLSVPGIEKKLPDAAARRARANELLAAQAGLKSALRRVQEVRAAMAGAQAIGRSIENRKQLEAAKPALRALSDKVRDLLSELRQDLGGVKHPYENTQGATNLGERIVGATPGWREFEQIFEAGDRCVRVYVEEQRRSIGELAEIAERVERDLAAASAAKAGARATLA